MVNPQFTLTVLDNGNLKISYDESDSREVRDCYNDRGDFGTLYELTESYWTNGWGVHCADVLGQMSECPVIAKESYIEDDGSTTLQGKVWYHPNYMVESMILTILEKGFIELPLWFESEKGENFKNPYIRS